MGRKERLALTLFGVAVALTVGAVAVFRRDIRRRPGIGPYLLIGAAGLAIGSVVEWPGVYVLHRSTVSRCVRRRGRLDAVMARRRCTVRVLAAVMLVLGQGGPFLCAMQAPLSPQCGCGGEICPRGHSAARTERHACHGQTEGPALSCGHRSPAASLFLRVGLLPPEVAATPLCGELRHVTEPPSPTLDGYARAELPPPRSSRLAL